jgi:hypothetical protein
MRSQRPPPKSCCTRQTARSAVTFGPRPSVECRTGSRTARVGLAIGAAIGALLPRTQAEDELMGDVSDKLKGQTSDFAAEQFEKVKRGG